MRSPAIFHLEYRTHSGQPVLHHKSRFPYAGAVEAAGLGRDGLLEGGDAVDDVQGQAEAPEPLKEVSRKAWLPN